MARRVRSSGGSGVSERTPEQIAADPDVRAAGLTLMRRFRTEARRATQSRRGSNAWTKASGNARFFHWAAGQLVADEDLLRRLRKCGVMHAGWRELAAEISTYARELEQATRKKATA